MLKPGTAKTSRTSHFFSPKVIGSLLGFAGYLAVLSFKSSQEEYAVLPGAPRVIPPMRVPSFLHILNIIIRPFSWAGQMLVPQQPPSLVVILIASFWVVILSMRHPFSISKTT